MKIEESNWDALKLLWVLHLPGNRNLLITERSSGIYKDQDYLEPKAFAKSARE